MRVLWVCNIMLPVIARELGMPYSNKEGWLSGLAERILGQQDRDITLGVCFPSEKGAALSGKLYEQELYYYGFKEDTVHEERYDSGLETALAQIIRSFQPDIVHCFGTEYGHTLAAVKAFGNPGRTLVGLQGICYVYADHYLDGVPQKVAGRSLFRDLVKRDNLQKQQKKMWLRGEREKEVLKLTSHVTGRTAFDKQAALLINPNLQYHFMNETMRSNFYGPRWNIEACERHSIFVSQGNYPIKGLHFMLRALAVLKETYPDVRLYVAGDKIVRGASLPERLKLSSYGKYIEDLIHTENLMDQVTFLGPLNTQEMCRQFLRSHVFASVSTIENSPNSVGEAMLLGVPVVSSQVGGVADMLADHEEGLLYPLLDTAALADAISSIFDSPKLAGQLSEAARQRAFKTHDADTNFDRLLEIYHDINVYQ